MAKASSIVYLSSNHLYILTPMLGSLTMNELKWVAFEAFYQAQILTINLALLSVIIHVVEVLGNSFSSDFLH